MTMQEDIAAAVGIIAETVQELRNG